MLPPVLLLLSTAVAVIAAAMRKRIIWIAPPTPVLSTMALAAGRDGHVLLVEVVELERGAADAVRRDEVQEGARELREHGRGRTAGPC